MSQKLVHFLAMGPGFGLGCPGSGIFGHFGQKWVKILWGQDPRVGPKSGSRDLGCLYRAPGKFFQGLGKVPKGRPFFRQNRPKGLFWRENLLCFQHGKFYFIGLHVWLGCHALRCQVHGVFPEPIFLVWIRQGANLGKFSVIADFLSRFTRLAPMILFIKS